MKLLAIVGVAVFAAGCDKGTCAKAAKRMVECKVVVGGLIPHQKGPITIDNPHGVLRGACDAACSDPAVKKQMECVAEASSCEDLELCQR
jgi:hypothetical protein